MFVSIGFWVLRLFRKDAPWTQQYARRIGWIVIGAILLLVVLPLGKCAYDRSVIRKHEAATALDAAKAENAADKVLVQDQRQFEAEQQQLEQAALEAKMQSPVEAAKPVGPVSRSYYDNLPEKRR